MSNANLKADTSGALTDIVITTDSGTATFTSTGSVLGGGDTSTSGSGSTITVTTAGGGGLGTLLNTPEWFDDFLWNNGTTGEIGELGWYSFVSSGTVSATSSTERAGVSRLTTGSSSTGRSSINPGSTQSFGFGIGETTWKSSLKLGDLSDGTNRFAVYAGINDQIFMANSGEGIYFSYSDNLNSGNWTLNTSTASGVNTTADSGVAATTDWVELSFVVNAGSTSVEFFIDGVSVGTITTTMPGTSDRTTPLFGILKSIGTTLKFFDVDAFYFKIDYTTPRFS